MTMLASPAQCRPDGLRPSQALARRCVRPFLGRGLSPERERELAARIKVGDLDARNELVEANLGLAKHFALRWRNCHFFSMEIDDLCQEAVTGLMRAAELYDPAKHHTRFSTYAAWWIKRRIRTAIWNQDDLVRMPLHVHERGQADDCRVRIAGKIERVTSQRPPVDHLAEVIHQEQRERLLLALEKLKARERNLALWWASESGQKRAPTETRSQRACRTYAAKKVITKLRAILSEEGTND